MFDWILNWSKREPHPHDLTIQFVNDSRFYLWIDGDTKYTISYDDLTTLKREADRMLYYVATRRSS